ncbi:MULTISPECIES: InlB B-repeat-containing protein [unclassified Enterococcus]|uniref:InlB B-repeat-containing protein n=1 Tax=unclassified Enterococcus TaxID=2608891 RepID=UPI001554E1FC|nr:MULTISPECIES: InlB B-repeat-containing protein [unclassified Enterococcus]MBS7577178.1 InlB B-repeat-containing protein [Enterococcus sp. MMGLQ5-2]MBS7584729.1 InlB B-repeat-containing protein [Enterococcus sp. MMGLQ5-1]NPD12584.1 hypothetical protein [Enterococcus sp. MMGLQ5-1]NPD37012.1 hypothetical protein [Enterococcus sp. MMGLQ5-2]
MRKMKTITIKWYLFLSALTLFSFGLLPASVIAETTDTDTHFAVDIIEASNSRSGAEAVSVTVKNIFNQPATNTVAKVVLPEKFAKRLGKATVTENIGTLKAGASRQFLIRLSDGSIKVLPTTSEQIVKILASVGFVLLAMVGLLFYQRKFAAFGVLAIIFAGTAVVSAASSYTHEAVHHHQTVVAGEKPAFKTIIGGDFELAAASDSTSSSSSESSASSTDASLPSNPDSSTDTITSSSPAGNSTSSSSEEEPVPSEEQPTRPAVKYKVSFDLSYETEASAPIEQSVVKGRKAKAPIAPIREGYRFDGWFEADSEVSFDFSTAITGDKTLYAKWTVVYSIVYHLDGGINAEDNPTGYTSESADISLLEPTKAGDFAFVGWYTAADFSEASKVSDVAIASGSTGEQHFYAKFEAAYTVLLKSYDGTETLETVKVPQANPVFSIPDQAKANHYFLGWATSASATKAESLYVPEDYADVRTTLNVPDQKYLGYGLHEAHQLTLSDSSTVLYAVHYQNLNATETPDEAAPTAQEFIWGNAIWRVLKATANNRLVLKVSALTRLETPSLSINYFSFGWSQLTVANSSSDTWFKDGVNGYDYAPTGYARGAIEAYYQDVIPEVAKANVLYVNLQNPTYTQYTTGLTIDQAAFQDPRFTTLYDTRFQALYSSEPTDGYTKQAFALSFGDLNTVMDTANVTYTCSIASNQPGPYFIGQPAALLDFPDVNDGSFNRENAFWLHSPSLYTGNACYVNNGVIRDSYMKDPWGYTSYCAIRPALWLQLTSDAFIE